jgi:predicted nucleic acid-binding Zn ribbon protein
VLNEAESETEAKTSPVDPVDDPSARRCRVCRKPVNRRNKRVCAGRCARIWKSQRQWERRARLRVIGRYGSEAE